MKKWLQLQDDVTILKLEYVSKTEVGSVASKIWKAHWSYHNPLEKMAASVPSSKDHDGNTSGSQPGRILSSVASG